ncbi:hypothetical protein [Microbacterium arborescens]
MPDWHAMLATEEREPGTWTMVAPDGVEYGTVRIVRVRGEIRYRVIALGRHVGWTSSLRSGCERIHHIFIASHSPGPPPGGIYPDLSGILDAGRDA